MADDTPMTEADTPLQRSGARRDRCDRAKPEHDDRGARGARALPDSLNISVDLPPAPVHEMPEDEVGRRDRRRRGQPGPSSTATPARRRSRSSRRHSSSRYRSSLAATHRRTARCSRPTRRGAGASGSTTSVRHVAVVATPGEAASGDVPEPPDRSRAERLLDLNRTTRPAPEGGFSRFVYDGDASTS